MTADAIRRDLVLLDTLVTQAAAALAEAHRLTACINPDWIELAQARQGLLDARDATAMALRPLAKSIAAAKEATPTP